ncbi:LysM peptidoglycan-binding domain-containing protein [Yoonia sp. R2-816]|uniref:LysM peptidoglycan-binding domain-containing protein n=1 Tax=Yoonia sp. R2-816 TaxID=3342638 RepID=UPI003727E9DF
MRALLLIGLIIPSLAFSGELIRCPDWKVLFAADRTAALRSTAAPETDFHEALNRTRAPLDATGGANTPATASCTYTIVAGDTLSRIAAARLGNAARWREIAALNQSTISNEGAVADRGETLRSHERFWFSRHDETIPLAQDGQSL